MLALLGSRGVEPIWEADFEALALGGGITLPNSLLIARASDGHSVQTSASTVVLTAAGNDTARVGQPGGATTRGLVLERPATNDFIHARDAAGGWAGGGTATLTVNDENGPDGTLSADRFNATSGQYSQYQAPSLTAAAYAFSSWQKRRAAAGAGEWQMNFYGTSHVATYGALTETFQRNQLVSPNAGASTAVIPLDARDLSAQGGRTATALDYLVDMTQVEAGLYPTEWIATAGAAVTRAGERLYLADRGPLLSSGRLNFEVCFIPKADSDEYGAAVSVWYVDLNNHASISSSSHQLTVTISGTAYSFPTPLSWFAGDVVELFVGAGGAAANSVAWMRVNGGAAIQLGESPTPQAAIGAVGSIDLLCIGALSQLTSWVQQIRTY